MRGQSIGDSEIGRLIAAAPEATVVQFREAAVEIVTDAVRRDPEFTARHRDFHVALEALRSSGVAPALRHELEAAYSAAHGRAARVVALAWLKDLGWLR